MASYLLPEGILEYFDVVEVKKVGVYLNISLEEQEKIPEEYAKKPYRNNGFMNEIQIKDFPIRDQLATLFVKRKRWLLTAKGQKVRRDWILVAPGTRMTKDLAAFLKELVRSSCDKPQSPEIHCGIKEERLQRQYKEKSSNYNTWEQNTHAEEYMLNQKNINERLAIDETAFTNGELYTVVGNKAAHGKKGTSGNDKRHKS